MPFVFLVMAAALGISSFTCGMIPLSTTHSRKYMDVLSALSTGLLLGTALGVIIPEGIEALIDYQKDSDSLTSRIAFNLIFGFLLMMTVEHLFANVGHSHNQTHAPTWSNGNAEVEFDAELGDLENDQNGHSERERRPSEITGQPSKQTSSNASTARHKAVPFTFGLILHGLADGCALGISAVEEVSSEGKNNLSFIVFFALLLHKAPTSVAFAVSLLNTNLPRADCKKYLSIFAAATPLGAVVSYFLLSFFGFADNTDLAGSALLVSGGTFLYVATVLQPVSQHQTDSQDLKPKWRLLLVVVGTLTPLILSSIIGHGH